MCYVLSWIIKHKSISLSVSTREKSTIYECMYRINGANEKSSVVAYFRPRDELSPANTH